MRQYFVDFAALIAANLRPVAVSFFQSTSHKTIFGIGNQGFRLIVKLTFEPDNFFTGNFRYGFERETAFQYILNMVVTFQKFNRQKPGGEFFPELLVFFQLLLNVLNRFFDLVAIIDMYVSHNRIAVFVHLNNAVEKLFQPFPFGSHSWYNRDAHHFAQVLKIEPGPF